jgi:amino acid permease
MSKIYSTEKIILDINKVVKKDIETCDLLKRYHEPLFRNFIQKYAEIEMTDYSRKFGEISFLIALFALIYSALDKLISLLYPDIYSKNRLISYIFIIIFLVVLVYLIYMIIIIARKKNQLNEIIIRIEEDRLKIQNDVDKSIRSEIKVPERDLKIKVDKLDLNLSISAER